MSALSLNELDADLDDFIVGDEYGVPEVDEPPVVVDIDQADRLLRRIARLDDDQSRLCKLAQARRDQIDEWLVGRLDVIERERNWYLRSVETWMRAQHAAGGAQTHKLPAGTLSLRKPIPKLDATGDPDPRWQRVAWDKAAAKKATEIGPELDDAPPGFRAFDAVDPETGEMVPGLTYLVARDPSFSYRTGGGQS